LDFHYSDSWADPGKQTKPAAWTNLTFLQLEQQIYVYSSNIIAAFKAAGAMPEYVQIGNEITGGMLWPDGQVSGSYNTAWSNLGRLMKAAINGIKGAAGATSPKIIIHIDRGGDWSTTQWYFDNIVYQNVPFDIIGESYYPWWHGDLSALSNCLVNAAQRYNKPVVVMETAFPWTNTVPASYNPNLGIPLTPAGQVEYTLALASIVKGIPAGRGIGLFWWGTEYVQLSGYNLASFQRTSFFDYGGNALPVLGAYGQLTAPVEITISLTGSSVSLKWPFSGAGMSLLTATNFDQPTFWSSVTNAVQSTGGIFSTTLPRDVAPRFYRLQPN
jgi:arabinogalactan endo-1,4-beta-galactosidase